jgi:alpha-L-arabinofuranosidase
MKPLFLLLLSFLSVNLIAQPQLTINTDSLGIKISPTLYGIFFEDINHAADGGLYAELISNRSFEDNASSPVNWTLVKTGDASGSISLDTFQKLNSKQTYELKIQAMSASSRAKVGAANSGFWGINVVNNRHYKLSFFAKASGKYKGRVVVSLENSAGTQTYASNTITSITNQWQKYTCELVASGNDPQGRFAIALDATGTVWFDMVSLFPPTFKNRENGLRSDLAQLLADLKPKFMRFPGGCFVEGDFIANRFQWKNTIGNIENRPGHKNMWGYRTSDGLGYHEFLQLAEDLGAIPLYVINIGIAHGDVVPYLQTGDYVQDALDAIEYANGPATSKYGAMRVANGHPEPFNLKYIEIGNENNQSEGFIDIRSDRYTERYEIFYNALKAKYPDLIYIGNVAAWGNDNPAWTTGKPTDMLDEHYYRDPQWFMSNYNKYDRYSRKGPKIYVGEYAVTSNCGTGNLSAALGEAAYMMGMERNSDVVTMCSYAPIFVNVNNRAWNPDIINFNSAQSYGTPSYYIQKLFANNLGDTHVPVAEKANLAPPLPVKGNIGLGSWATQVQYDSVVVTSGGKTLFSDQFSDAANWTTPSGTWTVSNGIYAQTSASTDCRSVANINITDTAYTYTLKARKTGGNEGFLIMFGHKDPNNFYWWNIGGWGNTQHGIEKCVNGGKTTVTSAPGSIVNNKWYLIRVEIKPGEIDCYIDNVLVHKLINPPTRILYTSASKNTSTNDVILKVLNPGDQPTTATISMLNTNKDTQVNGNITILKSAALNDENSFAAPAAIAPETYAIREPSVFPYTFPAYSVTVFNIKLSGGKAKLSIK